MPNDCESGLLTWLHGSPFGRYMLQQTQAFVMDKLTRAPLSTVLQLGAANLPLPVDSAFAGQFLFQAASAVIATSKTDVVAVYDAMPWATHSINTVIWPYGLDGCAQPECVMRELHRILAPGGQIVITGLNACGYWRLWYGHHANLRGLHHHTAQSVQQLFQKHGFTLSEAQFMGYRLRVQAEESQSMWELMGNRWWPHLAAQFGAVYTKETMVLTPLPQAVEVLKKQANLGWEAATKNHGTVRSCLDKSNHL